MSSSLYDEIPVGLKSCKQYMVESLGDYSTNYKNLLVV